jgi:hypothetical protein
MMKHARILLPLLMAGTLAAAPAEAQNHALIMTISNYQGGIPPLTGVKYDGENARAMARKMGVPDSHITQLSDQQLTLAGMRQAFDDLQNRLRPNDQVFIYYSGHGGRQAVAGPENRCAESLITVDGNHFLDAELETKLKSLSGKAEKIVVFLDACHSGGVTTRSVRKPGEPARFTPKSWPGGENCQKPVNVLTRNLGIAAKNPGSGGQNYAYIAAAQANEISLDQPGKGGVASQAWLECLKGAAKDTNGSGGISAEETRQCAQQKIEQTLQNVEGYTPHHISITGNPNAILSFANPASTAATPYNTLLDINNRRDDRRSVVVKPSKPAFQIGKDNVEFLLTSSHSGYVYLLMIGSDGKTFDMLFPNKIDKNNFIQAGEALRLPRSEWEIQAQGPVGKSHLLAIVADAPRDFDKVGLQPAGPFSMVAVNPVSAKDIQLVTGVSSQADSAECKDQTTMRNLAVQKKCSNAFGAAFMTVEEIN